jgi:anti-sigma factor RsiW
MSCGKWEIQILRWSERELDPGAEARLVKHLESCAHCRTMAEKFAEIDGLFSKCPEPSVPPFLTERIVSAVSDAIREDSAKGSFATFFSFLASFKPGIAGTVLVLGIGLGLASGWNLAESMSKVAATPSYDVLSLAELGGSETGSSLEFLWTDTNRRAGQ